MCEFTNNRILPHPIPKNILILWRDSFFYGNFSKISTWDEPPDERDPSVETRVHNENFAKRRNDIKYCRKDVFGKLFEDRRKELEPKDKEVEIQIL